MNLTYLAVTTLACARLAPTKTQVIRALGGPFGQKIDFLVSWRNPSLNCLEYDHVESKPPVLYNAPIVRQ